MASGGTCKHQVGHVSAADQQHERHGALQDSERPTCFFRDKPVVETPRQHRPTVVRTGVGLLETLRDRREIELRLGQGYARLEPADHGEPMVAARPIAIEDQGHEDVRCAPGHVSRDYADYGVGLLVK